MQAGACKGLNGYCVACKVALRGYTSLRSGYSHHAARFDCSLHPVVSCLFLQSTGSLQSLTKSVSQVSLKDSPSAGDVGIEESPRTVTGKQQNMVRRHMKNREVHWLFSCEESVQAAC